VSLRGDKNGSGERRSERRPAGSDDRDLEADVPELASVEDEPAVEL
jgi:hypothetical protein